MSGNRRAQGTARRPATVLAVLGGAALGAFFLLFAMANGAWTPVHMPNAPWAAVPSFAAFEARLWAIMLTCFVLGAGAAFLLASVVQARSRRAADEQRRRIEELEGEIARLDRLIAVRRDT